MPHPALIPPLFTPDLPGCGGVIRMRDEDFEVEEVPSYEPCGEGDHLYLWIEKRDLAPEFFSRTIANKLNISPGAVGTAGLKDRHAITRHTCGKQHRQTRILMDPHQFMGEQIAAQAEIEDASEKRDQADHGNEIRPGGFQPCQSQPDDDCASDDTKDSTGDAAHEMNEGQCVLLESSRSAQESAGQSPTLEI